MVQACAGIGYAHRAGLVHCDIKPHNITITKQKEIKIMDFGLAKVIEQDSAITRTQAVIGTPSYMSPEQLTNETEIDSRADIYSLGAVLYRLAVPRLPVSVVLTDSLGAGRGGSQIRSSSG